MIKAYLSVIDRISLSTERDFRMIFSIAKRTKRALMPKTKRARSGWKMVSLRKNVSMTSMIVVLAIMIKKS